MTRRSPDSGIAASAPVKNGQPQSPDSAKSAASGKAAESSAAPEPVVCRDEQHQQFVVLSDPHHDALKKLGQGTLTGKLPHFAETAKTCTLDDVVHGKQSFPMPPKKPEPKGPAK